MSGSYSSRLRARAGGGGCLGATTVLVAKVAFASAAVAAAASLARVAVPQILSGADAFLWKLYLFVTVHVIILVIWKLSDNKHFHAPAHKDPWAPVPHHPAPAEEVVPKAMKRKVELAPASVVDRKEEYRVTRPHIEAAAWPVDEGVVSPGSCDGDSCVTTESEEDGVVERGRSLSPPPAVAATYEFFNGDDDLDGTWNAIMQKTRPSTAPALAYSSPRAQRPRSREPSVGAAELSKRSEDFINKIHHSFGRQQ
uniref:Uncharacterized protein n=1 Tax=Avena sativa TaxID=4498 RepID=A0ACD5WLY4_AVESA